MKLSGLAWMISFMIFLGANVIQAGTHRSYFRNTQDPDEPPHFVTITGNAIETPNASLN